ncbi:hypothetical protein K0M31_002427 [Melipona bicolor]|uniref:Uncharacterized protein n=1 Tax=Melipona bicolor TaxID=60889 RepID=A0AA40GIK1_9HYME|nr:hypothetical protein K0M31_002427 [Melipona bicolor]
MEITKRGKLCAVFGTGELAANRGGFGILLNRCICQFPPPSVVHRFDFPTVEGFLKVYNRCLHSEQCCKVFSEQELAEERNDALYCQRPPMHSNLPQLLGKKFDDSIECPGKD